MEVLSFILTILLALLIVAGIGVAVMMIIALIWVVRVIRQVSATVQHGKECISKLCSLGGGASRVKQVMEMAKMAQGVISTLQSARRRGKK